MMRQCFHFLGNISSLDSKVRAISGFCVHYNYELAAYPSVHTHTQLPIDESTSYSAKLLHLALALWLRLQGLLEMKHLIADSPYCDRTLQPYVYNLTSSYADLRNEPTMVATSVGMLFLAATFFSSNLISGSSSLSASLKPSIRSTLSAVLSLFLPVMSYLFSEAKDKCSPASEMTELSLRARTILMWMLLVELLRHKVVSIRTPAGMQGYSGTIERAARIVWLGYLVFVSLRSTGKKALYGIPWVLASAKLVQRFATMELGKRSFAYGKNQQFIVTYMSQMLTLTERGAEVEDTQLCGEELLKQCNYIVMGEDELERSARRIDRGYKVDLMTEAVMEADSNVITVGKIWKLAETDRLLRKHPGSKRLCLSFALYKLLRPRLDQDFLITTAEARNCHDLIFKGLCQEYKEVEAVVLFQVLNDELQFLCEYYYSVHPVVFASPFFFLANYILFPIIVLASCILMIILCGNGEASYAFHSFSTDNYGITVGLMRLTKCIFRKVTRSPPDLFAAIDICIGILLALTFVYEEVWEFILFLVSDWLKVSLLCIYTSTPRWRVSSLFLHRAIRTLILARSMFSQPVVCFKRLSVLWSSQQSSRPETRVVPVEAKKAIMERLLNGSNGFITPSNCRSVLLSVEHRHRLQSDELLWTCESDAIAEVIVVWHIATQILEARHPLPRNTRPYPNRTVATALSMYCAYLVAFRPGLLPDDKDRTERVYKDVKKELKKEMGLWGYYCSPPVGRYDKLMEIAERRQAGATTTLGKGARLGKVLIDKYDAAEPTDDAAREGVWKLLADVWTEIMIYTALPGSEKLVKAHKEALEHGVEFITMIWALATHTGISRGPPATAATPPACV
ncbi:hypothetical protein ACP70R_041968 [Stipagrostis hirtigluma subsp. patula]